MPRPLPPARARRRHLDRRRHQVHRRPFRPGDGVGIGRQALRRPDLERCPAAGPDRQPGRCLQRAQGPAHGRRPPRHASGAHGRGHRLAAAAAPGQAHPLSGLARAIRATPCGSATSRAPTGCCRWSSSPASRQADADRFVDSLRLFGIGASWGGYESLALTYPSIHGWSGGALVRLHIGLEDPADIIEDLARGFAALG